MSIEFINNNGFTLFSEYNDKAYNNLLNLCCDEHLNKPYQIFLSFSNFENIEISI